VLSGVRDFLPPLLTRLLLVYLGLLLGFLLLLLFFLRLCFLVVFVLLYLRCSVVAIAVVGRHRWGILGVGGRRRIAWRWRRGRAGVR
jgi:hypothetical protein